jgi:hypothetical protein
MEHDDLALHGRSFRGGRHFALTPFLPLAESLPITYLFSITYGYVTRDENVADRASMRIRSRHPERERLSFRPSSSPEPSANLGSGLVSLVLTRTASGQKETPMTNSILVSEAALSPPPSFGTTIIPATTALSPDPAKTSAKERAAGKRLERRILDRSLLGAFLDPRTSSLSLKALAQAANTSGKRLVLEIRDETPVRIVRA